MKKTLKISSYLQRNNNITTCVHLTKSLKNFSLKYQCNKSITLVISVTHTLSSTQFDFNFASRVQEVISIYRQHLWVKTVGSAKHSLSLSLFPHAARVSVNVEWFINVIVSSWINLFKNINSALLTKLPLVQINALGFQVLYILLICLISIKRCFVIKKFFFFQF